MPQLTMTSKGQITINKALREGLGARPGEKLQVEVRPDGGLVIPPIQRRTATWAELAGSLKRPGQPVLTIEELNDAIADAGAAAGTAGLEDD
jgi:AbrB family looped-hinge helix DNA binding protein